MKVLIFNPGSNSLKAGVVDCDPGQRSADEGRKLVEVILEGIGKKPTLWIYRGKERTRPESIEASNFTEAADGILQWLDRHNAEIELEGGLDRVGCIAVRVVHGGPRFTAPAEVTAKVEKEISDLAKWAPLHNRRSVEILTPLRRRFPKLRVYAVFDTTFHCTIPPAAGLYAIPLDLSHRHGIRRYGFHGISHRYLMERYASIANRAPGELNLITTHLESGCSITAIQHGRSVDNTMGLTPLEGLMMGTRSGDVDASLLPFLVREEHLDLEGVMEILEKKSGLLGVSGKSLDTRVLMREFDNDEHVRLAMEMFSYRVLKAVGAYLTALGGADALVFGGGIAENTALVRQRVCDGLRWCGVRIDPERNRTVIDVEGRLSTADSSVDIYVIPTEETLQIAHEACQALAARG